jgi:hypothetical protein
VGRVKQTETLENYGCPKAKTVAKSSTHAPRIQQRAGPASTQCLSPVCGPLRAASGLPGLRLLQGAPGYHRHRRSLIASRERSGSRRFRSGYAHRSGCHGGRPRLRGRD